MHNPRALEKQVRRNATATLAVGFLYHFGLPFLRLRQAQRTADGADDIDMMWCIAYHWFRATHKTWYAIIAVVVTAIRRAMRPEIERVWTLRRTVSLLGHAGRNVAYDMLNEKLNLAFTRTAGQPITREKLKHVSCIINGINYMRPRFNRATGRVDDSDNGSDYENLTAACSAADVAKMDKLLDQALGENWAWWSGRSTVNWFDPDRPHKPANPVEHVRAVALGEEDEQDEEEDAYGDWESSGEEADDDMRDEDGEDPPSPRSDDTDSVGSDEDDAMDACDAPWWDHATRVIKEKVPWRAWRPPGV